MTLPTQINPKEAVCAILVGRAKDAQKAEKMVAAAKECPFVAYYTAKGDMVMGVFELPKLEQKWIEYPSEQPFILEMEPVMAVVTDQMCINSPWTLGLVSSEDLLAHHRKECQEHIHDESGCLSCAATIYFYAAE